MTSKQNLFKGSGASKDHETAKNAKKFKKNLQKYLYKP